MAKINTAIHDNFIRAILADKDIATDYFRNFLPSIVSNQLDFTTLTQIPDTYLSKNLQKTMSDIVCSCKKRDTEDHVKVSLLIEHKSYVDKYIPIQLGGYIFSGYAKQIANKEKLSLIIPVLLNHGKEKWEYQTLNELFTYLEPDWKKFLPDFDYVYNNLGQIADEEIGALENQFLVASILSLKHTFQKEWLDLNFQRILVLTEEAPANLQRNLVVYLFLNANVGQSKISEILESLPSTLKDIVMTTSEIFEKKGLNRGVEISKSNFVKNLLKNTNFTVTKIAMLSEVSEDLVIKIREGLNFEKS